MADEMKRKKAEEVYGVLCQALDDRQWHYEKEAEKLSVRFNVSGDDLSMRFLMMVDEQRDIIRLFSWMPFQMKERRMEGALATCYVKLPPRRRLL